MTSLSPLKALLPLVLVLSLGAAPDTHSAWEAVPTVELGIVHDGDTLTGVDVHLGYGVALVDETIRFSDVDCWELTKNRRTVDVTDAEIEKGKIAQRELSILLAQSKCIYLLPAKERRDNYGRLLGRLVVEDGDGNRTWVGEWLKQNGHCRE